MLPLTGDGAPVGIPEQKAVFMAGEEINAAGGIGGQQVEFISEDSKCDASAGAAAGQKLVSVDKVKIIFGGACSGETLAAAPVAEEAHVIIMSPSATNPDISNAGDYIFRTAPSDAGQGAVGAEYAYNTLGARKAAVISEQTDYAQGLRKVFTSRFAALGGEVVGDEVFQSKDTDLRAQMLKIKGASPEVVYLVPQTPATGELIMKQLKAQEVGVKLLGAEVMGGRDILAKEPTLFAGLLVTEPYFDERAGDAASFLSKYESKYNEKPAFPGYMANAYSQVYLIKEGIESVGIDTTKLKDWLYTVKGWKGALGELTFTADGDAIGQYSVKEVQTDGSLKELSVVRPQ
jgi:branched-chain amino acid transport system substrate-binding protein